MPSYWSDSWGRCTFEGVCLCVKGEVGSYFNLGDQVNSLVKKFTLEYWGYRETMYGICHIYGTLGSKQVEG